MHKQPKQPSPAHKKIKADRPHPHDYPQRSADYRHTDNHLRELSRDLIKSADGQTNGRMDRQTVPAFLSYVVDKKPKDKHPRYY